MPSKLIHVHAVETVGYGPSNAYGFVHWQMLGTDAVHFVFGERERSIVVSS